MTKDELTKLIEPAIEQLGFELSDLELKIGGQDGLVRVFIDKPDGITHGEDVRVKLRFPIAGRRNFRGALRAADEEKIEIEVDGEAHSLPLATIESARLVPAEI